MNSLYLFAYLCIGVGTILALEGRIQLLTSCKVTDMKCLRMSARQYLRATSKDLNQYKIKAIDPLVVSQYTEDLGYGTDIVIHMQDVNIIGLNNLELSGLLMDTMNNKVELRKKVDLKITGKVVVEYKKESKKYSGTVTATGNALVITTYPYEVRKDKSGAEHFELGEEDIIVKVDEVPMVKLDDELLAEIQNDESIKESRDKYSNLSVTILKDTMEKIIKTVVAPALMKNLRQAVRVLPKSAFLTM